MIFLALTHRLLYSLSLTVYHPLSGIADKIMVVSMGDEISLADPWDAKDAFPKWCQVS